MSVHKRVTQAGQVRWDVRLYRPDGREYSRTFRTRAEAERFQATERADRARGTWIDPTAGQVLFSEWADEWYRSSRHTWRPRTAEKHQAVLRRQWLPKFGHLAMSTIRPRQVQAAVNDLAEHYRPSTVNTYYRTLRALFRQAVELDVIGRTPCRGIKLPTLGYNERMTITPDQLHRLAGAVGDPWRCMIYLSGVMGLRYGEVAALRPVDLDLDAGQISITRSLSETKDGLIIERPKTTASIRTLTLPSPLIDELRTHADRIKAERGSTALLFADSRGGPLRRSNFSRRVFVPAAKAAKLDGLTFHGLRHSAATTWVAAGIDARTVQHRLGHADPRLTLSLYAHATNDADQAAAKLSSDVYWPD